MSLDDQSRARLRALAEAERADLGEAARSRIARRVVEEGPRVIRRARVQRNATFAACVATAVGLVAWLALDVRVPAPVASKPRTVEQTATAATTIAPRRGCEARGAIAPQWSADSGDAARIDLGAVGAIAVRAGATAWLDAADPCRIALRLEQGRVDVHAADLAGGELRVQTSGGDVLVHGTQFSVQHDADTLIVEVDEGRVAVQRRDGTPIAMVVSEQRLRFPRGGTAIHEALDPAARAAIRAALEQPAPPQETPAQGHVRRPSAAGPAPSSAVRLVAEADALWRRGERDEARDRYRKAGALSGPTAEAAWLALARRELSAGAPAASIAAIDAYETRFPAGELASEAAGIAYRAALQQGDLRLARRRAEVLQKRHPHTPQAEAAGRWLRGHPAEGPR
jgi:ferric-dicitrate binding protein FerR (iron transport regulator)